MLALEGIKILELAHLPPGELATMILGDMGAEVIKIEPLKKSNIGTQRDQNATVMKKGLAFNATNRNKKSICINLKSDEGKQIIYRMAKDADVVIEGFRPGTVDRLGIGYETISKLNPRIIYCSMSGYGQDGPYSQYSGHDINYISIAGALNMIGWADRHPSIPLGFVSNYGGASMHSVAGILLAIIARQNTGKGQVVDISFTDSAVTLMTIYLQQHLGGGLTFPRGEWVLGGAYPYYTTYETKDGKLISLGCTETWLWENLCDAIGREDLKPFSYKDEHLFNKPDSTDWDMVKEELVKVFKTRSRDEWFDFLGPKDVPVGKVYSIDEVTGDRQLQHRQMFIELDHPQQGRIKQPGIAIKLSETPGKVRSFAPLSGEHTDRIMQSLGYTKAEIEGLRNAEIID